MEDRKRRIKDIPKTQRPYERMEHAGAAALSDVELLSILIRSGRTGENSLDLAQRVLELDTSGQGISFLYGAAREELTLIPGIGRVKAMQLLAAAELGRRAGMRSDATDRVRIGSPEDVAGLLAGEMSHLPREELRVVCLDVRNRLIRTIRVSEGGLFAADVSPRDLFREVIKTNASGVILAHNHPSGDPEPSKEDTDSTRRMVQAGDMLGIRVLDHLVIASGGQGSLRKRGLM
ncbi:MAG: DNA repair protein RadC [Clostridiaceae bacterium]|nr:DNA repair protein RadC [Clostridiaceae bacterium]